MDALKNLKTRQSYRKYLPYSIDIKVMQDIIDCGRLAPSARNSQDIRYIIVDDKDMLKKLSEICLYGKFFKDCGAVVAVISKENEYIKENCSASTQNILLAANAYNLGTCWVASYKKAHSEEVEKMLKIPSEYSLFSLIAVGEVAEKTPRPQKAQLKDILSINKF